MSMQLPEIHLSLPGWVEDFMAEWPEVIPGIEDRMRFVIALAEENVSRDLGGPFAAAVFDQAGRLIAPGVNRVVAANCSIFHAEIVAIALAQKWLGRYDLSDGGRLNYELFATAEPCAMCFGAVPWSGVRRLVCGARGEDARRIGFDEGAKPDGWISALNERGVAVIRDVGREEAVAVLRHYMEAGGPIYNAGRPGPSNS